MLYIVLISILTIVSLFIVKFHLLFILRCFFCAAYLRWRAATNPLAYWRAGRKFRPRAATNPLAYWRARRPIRPRAPTIPLAYWRAGRLLRPRAISDLTCAVSNWLLTVHSFP